MSGLFDKLRPIADRLAQLGDGPLPFNTTIDAVVSATDVVIGGRPTLMCGSNNYLGLSFHPEVLAAAHAALDREGAGTTGSRAANGSYAGHQRLERRFAELYGTRHALIFTTGYQANVGMIAGLCGADDAIVLDAESHASIYDGARLSGAQTFAFRHNTPEDLRRKLGRVPDPHRTLVVVEGLYSISGDIAPLRDIVAVCREAGALVMVDEAHSFGVFGERGLGCAEAQGVLAEVDFVVGTFSKTLAGVGGYSVSNHDALELLQFAARPYVFTASGSPANIAGVTAALDVMQREASLRDRLWANVRQMRTALRQMGFSVGAHESPIVPIEIGSAEATIAIWRALLERGLYVNIVLPPGCRAEACLLRTSYSAAHTSEQLDRALAILEETGRALGVIRPATSTVS